MSSPTGAAPATPASALRAGIERFLDSCREPVLLSPGDPEIPIKPGCYLFTERPGGLLFEAWDATHNLARRVTALRLHHNQLELTIVRFGGKPGTLILADAAHSASVPARARNSRSVLAQRLALWCSRQFPAWRVDDLSSGADLEHSLSPAYARACLSHRGARLALLAAEERHATYALTQGLIWLDYLRRQGPVRALVLFLPLGQHTETLLRLPHLNVEVLLYCYDETAYERLVEGGDGNLCADLQPFHSPAAGRPPALLEEVLREPGVEAVPTPAGALSLRVRGLEFARLEDGQLSAGVDRRRSTRDPAPLLRLARQLAAIRQEPSSDPKHPWRHRNPEAWLESILRHEPRLLDAGLQRAPVYSQVGATLGLHRGIADLLAVDANGRLAVIEIKASEDPNLPLQALDYWLRIAHHAASGSLARLGYFPGLPLSPAPPRLFLVAPALQFHPTTEIVLQFFAPHLEIERIGLSVKWQRDPKVVLRAHGASRPEWDQPDL